MDHSHSYPPGTHSAGHVHLHGTETPHPAQPLPWSILRMTLAARLGAAFVAIAGLWAALLLAMR